MTIIIAVLLSVLVASLWLAAWGLARLRAAYDRVHCLSFAIATAGPVLVVTGFVADGASDRAWKILLLVVLLLSSGTALTHATGRAIAFREARGVKPRARE